MDNELESLLDALFSLESPIYFSLFLTLAIFALIYIFLRYILFPLQKKHSSEKKDLELKNARLMALFTELDPDPVIRIDSEGKIIFTNDAAKNLSSSGILLEKNINELISEINFSIKDAIKNNLSRQLSLKIENKYYSILFRGTSYLNIGQFYFRDISERKEFEEKLVESRRQLKELSKHLQNKLEEERQRIARELHDGIGQNLLLLKLRLQAIEEKSAGGYTDYPELIETLESSIKDLKQILYDLKPRILEEMGLKPALAALCEKISKESGINGSIDFIGNDERFDNNLEVVFYRITQEAMNNIVKHSKASDFNIQLINQNNFLRLMISDDGIGFDQSLNKNGMGLINMKERIESFRGNLKIDSAEGTGTVIIVEIPKEAAFIENK